MALLTHKMGLGNITFVRDGGEGEIRTRRRRYAGSEGKLLSVTSNTSELHHFLSKSIVHVPRPWSASEKVA
jgi:hypothetical protein